MNFLQKVATDIIKNMNDEIVVDTNNIDENRNNSSVQVLVLIIFSLWYIRRKHINIKLSNDCRQIKMDLYIRLK